MAEIYRLFSTFLHDGNWTSAAGYLGVISLVTFALSVICLPLLVASLPQNIFIETIQQSKVKVQPRPLRILLIVLRNIVGLVLLVSGIAMLFLPGQGLLTIVLAMLLLTFPGKSKLLVLLIHQEKVQRSLDWLRRRQRKPPFLWP